MVFFFHPNFRDFLFPEIWKFLEKNTQNMIFIENLFLLLLLIFITVFSKLIMGIY